jgi:hypothetical protein
MNLFLNSRLLPATPLAMAKAGTMYLKAAILTKMRYEELPEGDTVS